MNERQPAFIVTGTLSLEKGFQVHRYRCGPAGIRGEVESKRAAIYPACSLNDYGKRTKMMLPDNPDGGDSGQGIMVFSR